MYQTFVYYHIGKSNPFCRRANQSHNYKSEIVFNSIYHLVQLYLPTDFESDALLSKGILGASIRYIYKKPFLVESNYSNFFCVSNTFRGSHRKCSIRKVALKSFATFTGRRLCSSLVLIKLLVLVIFTGKRLCWSLFLIKFQAWSPTQAFSCKYSEMFENPYFENHLSKAASVLWSDFVY